MDTAMDLKRGQKSQSQLREVQVSSQTRRALSKCSSEAVKLC